MSDIHTSLLPERHQVGQNVCSKELTILRCFRVAVGKPNRVFGFVLRFRAVPRAVQIPEREPKATRHPPLRE